MGNTNSTNQSNEKSNSVDENKSNEIKPNKNVAEIMDYVATNYILTMDFESLKKLYNKKYCDNLIILTSDIVQKYFTNTDITYLSNRIQKKDNLIFINRNDIETIDELDPTKKQDLCNGIAKFYITIAHVFASIITTINPLYIFKDLNGQVKKLSLNERSKIPYGIKTQIMKYNICDNRINSLRNNSLFDKSTGDLTINPSVCNINLRDDGQLKSLEDEPGIPELIELYNDDNYDFDTGTFSEMSETTKQMFQENLKIFYTTFTGNEVMPPEITKFSDIKLRDYNKDGNCVNHLNNSVSGNISNDLFGKYASNLKEMIAKTNKNRDNLIGILNKLFVYFIDVETKSKKIRINPELTEGSLKDVIIETRASIIKLYLNCEQDYVEGIKIYEAIVEQKILETSQNQIKSLKMMSEKLISTDEDIVLPEDKIISDNKSGEPTPQMVDQQPSPPVVEQQPTLQPQPSPQVVEQQPTLQPQPSPQIVEQQPTLQPQPSPQVVEQQPTLQPQPSPQIVEQQPTLQQQPSHQIVEQQPTLQTQQFQQSIEKIEPIELKKKEIINETLSNEIPPNNTSPNQQILIK
jgi:hypothetical protein